MAVTDWDVDGHRVRLRHSPWTGRAQIAVDDRVIFARPRLWTWTDPGLSHQFQVGGASCLVRVTSRRFGYRYELLAGAEPANAVAPRRRWRIPVSLRIFAAFLLLTGGTTATFTLIRAQRQHAAFERMSDFHASIGMIPHGPKWLRDSLGKHWRFILTDVVDVDLSGTQIADDDLAQLRKLPALKELSLEDAPFITDVGMVHLRGLASLRELSLAGTQVSDAALANLASLNGLDELDLQSTKVTDSGMAVIGALPRLKFLYLTETQITDDGVASLTGLRELAVLWLAETHVTGACFAHLKSFPDLFSVSFSGTPVTDEGSECLAELTELVKLDISNTRITDTTLVSLRKLTNLRLLNIVGTQLTDAGVAELQRALPKLKVVRNEEGQ